MCTGGDQVPGNVAEALGMVSAGLDYLNGPAGETVDPAALGGILQALAEADAKHSAAWMRFLTRFDANGCHDADGYATSAAWRPPSRGSGASPRPAPVTGVVC
jgi:hypothetical protein